MSLSVITVLMGLLVNALRLAKEFKTFFVTIARNRTIRKRYKDGQDAVKDGRVDDINDILTGRKG